jgi:hypothetical protein
VPSAPKGCDVRKERPAAGHASAGLGCKPFEFYGIRSAAEGLLDAADERHRTVLLSWLLQVANTAPQSLMALDAFLGRPPKDYPATTVEQTADLPVRNIRPVRPSDDVR